MAVIALIAGIAIGGGGVALLLRARLAADRRDLIHSQEEVRRVVGERDRAVTGADELAQSLSQLSHELTELRTTLEHERTAAAEKSEAAERSDERARGQFEALSAEVLDKSIKQLLTLAKSEFGTLRSEAKGDLEQRQSAVAELVNPIKESLTKVDNRLEQLERDNAAAGAKLTAEMKTLVDASDRLRAETGSLTLALRAPHTRGRWAELQLRRVVEMVGMTGYCDFVEQKTVHGADGALRPDLIVSLPGGKQVVVDAKAPLQRFLDAAAAGDENSRREHLVAHARGLRDHIKKLSAKGYWAQFEAAPDFVILFLPGEHFYSAALEIEPGLIEEGVNQCVLIATPMTLITLLRAVSYGWQQEKVAESARAVSALGRELHSRLSLLVGRIDKLGRRLNSTVGAYNDAVGTLEGRVLPTARRFEDHGAVSAGKELPPPPQVDTAARVVQAPELRPAGDDDGEEHPAHAA